MKILAVDDDPVFLEVLVQAGHSLGYHNIATAASANEARARLLDPDFNIDCMLLDIQMPGESGVQLCRAIRAMPRHAAAPIIMLTAMALRAHIDEAFAAGATDYLCKPLNTAELNARLGNVSHLVGAARQPNPPLEHGAVRSSFDDDGGTDSCSDDRLLAGVPSAVSSTAMANYLKQLSLTDVYRSSAVAIAIPGFDDLRGRTNSGALAALLRSVGTAIADQLCRTTFLICYYGNGTFVCITRRADPAVCPRLLRNLQAAIRVSNALPGSSNRGPIKVVMGQRQSSDFGAKTDPMLIVANAIASADKASQASLNASRSSTVRELPQIRWAAE